MIAQKYVGRAPDSDFSVLPRKYVTDRYDTIRLDMDFINAEVSSQAAAANLVGPGYVTQQDNLRARKTAVDAADALYVPTSQRGAANGVVPLDGDSYVPSQYWPSVQSERKFFFVPATTVILSGDRVVSSTNAKEYQAATLTIPDPGFPYIPLIFAQILGGSTLGNAANRSMGTGSFGQVSVLRSDNQKYAWCLATSHKTLAYHNALPFADSAVDPAARPPLEGTNTFGLWLGLWSGTTYTFNSTGLQFYALVYPGF